MKGLIAFRGHEGHEALALGTTLRNTTAAELVVAAVLPPTSDSPGVDRVDLEYRTWLDRVADDARTEALAALAVDGAAAPEFRRVAASSVAAGLVHTARTTDADVVIVGSAQAATDGSFLIGSVASRLLHSAPVPLLLAPHGYVSGSDVTFESLTCAYVGTDRSREALATACDLAKRYDVDLRVATFVPRSEPMYPPEVGLDAEDMVAAQWAEQAVALHSEVAEFCSKHGVDEVEMVVGRGRGWAGALRAVHWRPHDILVFGSSRLGPLARVFMGSTASRILRHTPVSTLVIPAGTTSWSE